MNNKRWITFDLDGTLMQNPFGAWVFPEITEVVSRRLGHPHDIVSEMVEEHEARMKAGRYIEAYDWDDILRERFRELGIPDAIEIEPLVRKHSVPPKVKLLESGILEVLSDLKARGYFLAAVTNGFYKFQAPVMAALGLIDKFDEVVTPERAGAGKPDPAILQGLGGQIIAHVGDRLDHDVQLANRYDVAAILIHKDLTADLKSLSPLLRVKDPAGIQLCIEKARKETKNVLWNELTAGLTPAAIIESLHEIPVILDVWKES